MAKQKVAPVLGSKKHPRYLAAYRIYELSRQLINAIHGFSESPQRADKRQESLDKAIAEYLSWAPMKNVAHDKKLKADRIAKRKAQRAAERAREKARKAKAREAEKKRAKAAKAKAKRDKVKAAKAAKKAAAQAAKEAKKPYLTLVPDAAVG
jgi:hypothetical protein